MARTAPVPNAVAIPGMNPGLFVLGGGGDGGGSGAGGGNGKGGKQGANGKNGGKDANGGGKGAGSCGPGSGNGCTNPAHGTGGGTAAGDPVDVATGRVETIPALDLVLAGPVPVKLYRSYSSARADRDVGLGHGWAHSLSWEIECRRRTFRVHRPEGPPFTGPLPEIGGSTRLSSGALLRREIWGFTLDAGDYTLLVFLQAPGDDLLYRLAGIHDRNGNAVTLHYEGAVLAGISDSARREVIVRRTSSGRIASFDVVSSDGRPVSVPSKRYVYDDDGDLVSVLDGEGNPTDYAYTDHLLERVRYASGLSTFYRYDASGRCVETWCERPGDTSLDAGVPEALADRVTPAKGFLHYKLDFGAPDYVEVASSREVRRYGLNDQRKIGFAAFGRGAFTSTFDANGNLTSYTDGAGAVRIWERDGAGRVVAALDPDGNRTTNAYDERGDLVETVDPHGNALTFEYDGRGNRTRVSDSLGLVIHYLYDEAGQVAGSVLPDGGRTIIERDAQSNPTRIVEPNGAQKILEYDALGRVTGYLDERGQRTSYVYDARGLLLETRLPNGGRRTNVYDADGRLVRSTDADGRTHEILWGGYGAVTEVKKPDGARVLFRYDREGQLVRIVNERGEEHVLLRDGAGRVVGERTFDGRTVKYDLDSDGNILAIENAAGDKTEMERDSAGRIVERACPDGSEATFEYDGLGRLVRATNESAEVTWAYDARGRCVRETQTAFGQRFSVESAFGPRARTSRRTSLGYTELIEVDALGKTARLTLDNGDSIAFVRDAAGKEVRRTLPGGAVVETYRDLLGRVERRRVLRAAAAAGEGTTEPAWVGDRPGEVTWDRTFVWSAGLDVREEHERGTVSVRRYDPTGRPVARGAPEEPDEQYGYDAAGNLFTPSERREYGPGGVLARSGERTFEHDADGRVVARLVDTADGAEPEQRYSWGGHGVLREVRLADGSVVRLDYDAVGRRVRKEVTRRDGTVAVTRFVWDGDVLVHEIRSSPAAASAVVLERTYVFEPGTPFPVAHADVVVTGTQRRRSGTVYYLEDCSRAPDALLSGDGEVLAALDLSLWGASSRPRRGSASARTSPKADTPLRFAGQYEDAETGLAYSRHRYYDAPRGRYLSPDPFGVVTGTAPYAYARSKPHFYIDPLGLIPVTNTVTGSAGTFSADSGGNPGEIHPVVGAAMAPQAGGVYPSSEDGVDPGRPPTSCGEPRAMTQYINAWEIQNGRRRPDGTPINPLNPNNPNDQADIQRCLGSITNIQSTQGSPPNQINRAPCPNCSQLFAQLNTTYGAPSPSVIQPGFQNAQGTGPQTNFSAPTNTWLQNQHLVGVDPSFGTSQNPGYVPHTGYGNPTR